MTRRRALKKPKGKERLCWSWKKDHKVAGLAAEKAKDWALAETHRCHRPADGPTRRCHKHGGTSGDTLFINEGIDRELIGYEQTLSAPAQLYAGDHDLRDPLLSPIYGDFEGFSPTYLVTGTRDLFLSDTARTHRKLREAGVTADLNVYEGMAHAGYIFVPDAPESHQVFRELDMFLPSLPHTITTS